MSRIGWCAIGLVFAVFLSLIAPRHAFSAEAQQMQVAQRPAPPLHSLQLALPRPVYQPVGWQEGMLAPAPVRPRGQRHVVLHDASPGQPDLLLGAQRGALQTYFERKW